MTYLQRFKFDKLKIDRGFVGTAGRDAQSQAVVQAIVVLGRAMDLTLLAEGVETEEQRVLLRLAGCDEMQGICSPCPRRARRSTGWSPNRPKASRSAPPSPDLPLTFPIRSAL